MSPVEARDGVVMDKIANQALLDLIRQNIYMDCSADNVILTFALNVL